MNINSSVKNEKGMLLKQLEIVDALLFPKGRKELKVLAYMLRHSDEGSYIIRRNYCSDIAKSINSTAFSVKKMLALLKKKGLIKYVTNLQGNNLGIYTFHPIVTHIAKYPTVIKFNFKIENK